MGNRNRNVCDGRNNIGLNISRGIGVGASFALPRVSNISFTPHEYFTNLLKSMINNKQGNITQEDINNFILEINE